MQMLQNSTQLFFSSLLVIPLLFHHWRSQLCVLSEHFPRNCKQGTFCLKPNTHSHPRSLGVGVAAQVLGLIKPMRVLTDCNPNPEYVQVSLEFISGMKHLIMKPVEVEDITTNKEHHLCLFFSPGKTHDTPFYTTEPPNSITHAHGRRRQSLCYGPPLTGGILTCVCCVSHSMDCIITDTWAQMWRWFRQWNTYT